MNPNKITPVKGYSLLSKELPKEVTKAGLIKGQSNLKEEKEVPFYRVEKSEVFTPKQEVILNPLISGAPVFGLNYEEREYVLVEDGYIIGTVA